MATPRAVVSIACWRTVTLRAQGPPEIVGNVCVHVAFLCLTCQVWGVTLVAFAVVGRFPAFFVHLCLHKGKKLLEPPPGSCRGSKRAEDRRPVKGKGRFALNSFMSKI